MGKVIIRVPATSANLGPGFDSVGAAFQLYLTVIIEEKTSEWRVNHALGEDVPHDERNLMVQTALKIAPDLAPHQLTVMSDIPIARGLGSSSSAIIAGIKIANELGQMALPIAEQLNLAAQMEGHPDNVAPALMGDAVVARFDGAQTTAVALPLPAELQVLTFIRAKPLLTTASRGVLPGELPFATAVKASGTANVMVAALATQDFATAALMMEQDQFHERARDPLVPELTLIRQKAHELGIHGTYLSGAGPTIATFGRTAQLTQLRSQLASLDLPGSLRILDVDHDGATVTNE